MDRRELDEGYTVAWLTLSIFSLSCFDYGAALLYRSCFALLDCSGWIDNMALAS